MEVQAFVDWLSVVFGMGAALAGLTAALVAVIKTAADQSLPARYYPLVSLTVGVLVALFVCWVAGIPWQQAVLIGAVAGLMAAKLFEYGKEREVLGP